MPDGFHESGVPSILKQPKYNRVLLRNLQLYTYFNALPELFCRHLFDPQSVAPPLQQMTRYDLYFPSCSQLYGRLSLSFTYQRKPKIFLLLHGLKSEALA